MEMMKVFASFLVWRAFAGAHEYDYVVVGGGVAGSVVATRLAATHSVLLLNIAGAPPKKYNGPVMTSDELIVESNLTATPGMRTKIHQPGYEPMPFFSTAETGSSPARYLGGSSLVGLSLFLYENIDWAPGWDWNVMQNYMLKSNIQPTHHPAYLHPLTKGVGMQDGVWAGCSTSAYSFASRSSPNQEPNQCFHTGRATNPQDCYHQDISRAKNQSLLSKKKASAHNLAGEFLFAFLAWQSGCFRLLIRR